MDKCDSGLNANTKPFITVTNIDLNAAKGNLNKLGTNNNLSLRDICALNHITYEATHQIIMPQQVLFIIPQIIY